MRAIALASIRHHGRRFIATGVAIVIAVAFVVAGLITTTSFTTAMNNAATAEFKNVHFKISSKQQDNEDTEEGIATLEKTIESLQSIDGIQDVSLQQSGFIAAIHEDIKTTGVINTILPESMRWYALTQGSWPTKADEIVLGKTFAENLQVSVGQTIQVMPEFQQSSEAKPMTVVGILDSPPGMSLFNDIEALVTHEGLTYTDATPYERYGLVRIHEGANADSVKQALTAALRGQSLVIQSQEAAAKEALEQLQGGDAVIQAFVLAFGVLALIVAGFIIANTFQLIIAQRVKELALLRCVGTTRKQVRRMILGEAALIGLVFSILGVVVGIGLAYGLHALSLMGEQQYAFGEIVLNPIVLLLCAVLGTITTIVFAYWPARRATAVRPLQALRPTSAQDERRSRTFIGVIGIVLAIFGTAGMVFFALNGSLPLAIIGGFFSAIGVLLSVQLVLPYLIWAVGQVVAPLNASTQLAVANTLRNKSRTAATGTALLIGTVLVSLLATGIYSSQESILTVIDERRPIDLVAQYPDLKPLDTNAIQTLYSTKDVVATAQVNSSELTIEIPGGGNSVLKVLGYDAQAMQQVLHSPVALPQPGTLFAHSENPYGLKKGMQVNLVGPSGKIRATVELNDRRDNDALDIAKSDLLKVAENAPVDSLFIKITPGLSAEEVKRVINRLSNAVEGIGVGGGASERAMYTEILQTILYVLLALLGVSILIAVVGLGNTAALSVFERRHESAMLRAVGLTRSQLHGVITTEAVLAAVVTVTLGLLLGIGYAWAGVEAIEHSISNVEMNLFIPWGQIGLIVIGAFFAGLLAAALPAMGAVRRPIVTDLATP